MFAGIAHRYDFLNHFLSMSVDRYWRRVAARRLQQLLNSVSIPLCLDLCSGTGDLALVLHRSLRSRVVASDFCHPMLIRAYEKIKSNGLDDLIPTVEADALVLPFADETFNAVTVAFGLRNLADLRRGLQEMLRVLKRPGVLVALEFSRPVIPVFRQVFNIYFLRVLPKLGALVSGDSGAYQYLPKSVQKFPTQGELAELMRSAGFSEVGYHNLTGGIAALHWGKR
jgi:demethylmenaquinone methyltransferase/2-methoxy-6-polyprenyl-1,4-benzoquinol methylase